MTTDRRTNETDHDDRVRRALGAMVEAAGEPVTFAELLGRQPAADSVGDADRPTERIDTGRHQKSTGGRYRWLAAAAGLLVVVGLGVGVVAGNNGPTVTMARPPATTDRAPSTTGNTGQGQPETGFRDTGTEVPFREIAVGPSSLPAGSLRAATNDEQFDQLWSEAAIGQIDGEQSLVPRAARPEVDFHRSIVVAMSVRGSECSTSLERLYLTTEASIAPEFVTTAIPCPSVLPPTVHMVEIDRARLLDTVTFRLPADKQFDSPEATLTVDVAGIVPDPSTLSTRTTPVWGYAEVNEPGALSIRVGNSCPNLDVGVRSSTDWALEALDGQPRLANGDEIVERGVWSAPSGGTVTIAQPGGYLDDSVVYRFPDGEPYWGSVITSDSDGLYWGNERSTSPVDDGRNCPRTLTATSLTLGEFIAFIESLEFSFDM